MWCQLDEDESIVVKPGRFEKLITAHSTSDRCLHTLTAIYRLETGVEEMDRRRGNGERGEGRGERGGLGERGSSSIQGRGGGGGALRFRPNCEPSRLNLSLFALSLPAAQKIQLSERLLLHELRLKVEHLQRARDMN
ncbi:Hypothetical predicted protein [Scomber scombrus]|uniref:Uncharacterized protein n=1 Tax=Scomber scombrus TaxID=13677 RepID=A0AAV1NGT1_SCOSC